MQTFCIDGQEGFSNLINWQLQTCLYCKRKKVNQCYLVIHVIPFKMVHTTNFASALFYFLHLDSKKTTIGFHVKICVQLLLC